MVLSSLVTSFLGALQASLAVLLTISYGIVASQFQILRESSAKDISKLCVRLFLPALLITNVGAQLHLDTASRYVPILVWSLVYTLLSLALGLLATRLFKLPSWVTPAVAFNNTTSLPLLLVQALDATGVLAKLLMNEHDTSAEAVQRAKSYFLVCAVVGNSLTFALGPKLLDGENAPDESSEQPSEGGDEEADQDTAIEGTEDAEAGRTRPHHRDGRDAASGGDVNEATSLLPDPVVQQGQRAGRKAFKESKKYWDQCPHWLQAMLDLLYAFINPPLIGAVTGAVLGLVPPLHRLFFNGTEAGGFFKAWLTTSIQNIGELFPALQLVVVGSKLSNSLRKMKKGEASGTVPWSPMLLIFAIRFVAWPLISIAVIWAMATRTQILGPDPMLWFCMMLMPTGPPAIMLMSLADVNGTNELEKMAIAKFLTIAYVVSPVICFAVVGSLRACEAAMT
ncbi:MAG: hypothetical protein M1838_000836 [Thelocarpon superellum]|nr:MAG: hypothetical protein M1838_000836 [Thelocarpon superellum]